MKSFFSTKKGFTLVELLVVISIIGMLASVVLVALQGARDKGIIGGGLQFATYNYHYLGAGALAIYNFNEPNGTIAGDLSVNNFTATLFNCASSPFCKTSSTPSGSGNALLLSAASSQYAAYTSATGILASNITQMAASVWINPIDLGVASPTYRPILLVSTTQAQSGTRNLYIDVRNGNTLWIETPTCSAGLTGVVSAGKWQNVTVSLNGTAGIVYVNGKQVGILSSCTAPNFNPLSIYMGAGTGGTFNGSIDDVALYTQSLTDAQVEEVYVLGATKHGLAVK